MHRKHWHRMIGFAALVAALPAVVLLLATRLTGDNDYDTWAMVPTAISLFLFMVWLLLSAGQAKRYQAEALHAAARNHGMEPVLDFGILSEDIKLHLGDFVLAAATGSIHDRDMVMFTTWEPVSTGNGVGCVAVTPGVFVQCTEDAGKRRVLSALGDHLQWDVSITDHGVTVRARRPLGAELARFWTRFLGSFRQSKLKWTQDELTKFIGEFLTRLQTDSTDLRSSARYRCEVMNPDGDSVEEIIEANSKAQAQEALERRGMFVRSIKRA